MASDLTLLLRFARPEPGLLVGAPTTPFVAPAALGALAARPPADELFVAGVAIEDFLCRVARRAEARPASVRVARGPGAVEQYLAARAHQLGRDLDRAQLSPYEVRDPSHGISRLRDPSALGDETFCELSEWCAPRGDALAWVVFAVDLVANGEIVSRGVRWLTPDAGPRAPAGQPLVLVRAGRMQGRPDVVELMLSTTAPVWLRRSAGDDDADENLARLGALCARLAEDQPGLIEAELALDGRAFTEQRTRVRATLEAAVGRALP